MIIYLALGIYIVSLILSVFFFITGKQTTPFVIRIALIVHSFFLIFFIISLFLPNPTGIFRFTFLLFVCSGLISGGIIIRTTEILWLKVYFSILFLTLLYFIYSPFRFSHFLLTANPSAISVIHFHLHKNYYLEQQTSARESGKPLYIYKMVQQFGVFHKTIKRDISFVADPDSIKVTGLTKKEVFVRVYFHLDNAIDSEIDSTDITLPLEKETTRNQIERRI